MRPPRRLTALLAALPALLPPAPVLPALVVPGLVLPALVLPILVVPAGRARAADPQPYATTLAPTGDAALDQALRDSSTLVSLQTAGPVGPFGLIARARQDVPRLQAVLGSFGFYAGRATILIDGRALDDPALFDRIEAAPDKPPLAVSVAIDTGPRFRLGTVTIQGDPPQVARDALKLAPGQPAQAAEVLAARDRMLTALRDAGYALAKAPDPIATLHADRQTLDVAFPVTAGPRLDIGAIAITGLDQVNPDFARRQLTIKEGDPFSPALVEAGRTDLVGLGVFGSVRAIAGTAPDAAGGLPITYQVSERKRHQVNATIAYSTDLGAEGSVSWLNRNLLGNAEQLRLTAGMSLGGTAQPKPGYAVAAQFIKPAFPWRDTALQADLGAVDQSLQAYDRKAVTGDVLLNYKPTAHWTFSAGVNGEQSQITQEGMTDNYTLVGLPLVARYDDTDNLFDPTRGVRVAALVTPTQSLSGKPGTFVLSQLTGSTYFDVSALWRQPGRSVVALRGLIGRAFGVGQFGLPPDQRFYAGGSATVRGYKFQTVGPLFPDGNPEGGTAISAGTVEYRQRVLDNWGFVLFADAGQVTANGAPFGGAWRVGVGGGLRYYTSIGPIRVDVAVPVEQTSASGSFQLYIGIGQAF